MQCTISFIYGFFPSPTIAWGWKAFRVFATSSCLRLVGICWNFFALKHYNTGLLGNKSGLSGSISEKRLFLKRIYNHESFLEMHTWNLCII